MWQRKFQQPPVRKNNTTPAARLQCIFAHVIFSSFTPLVPIHDRARNTTENSFVHKIDENSPVVRWKFHSILSITSNVTPHSFRVE